MPSMPASRRARAMIFAPRSWPSSPGLATTTRIFRVWVLFTGARMLWDVRLCHAADRHGSAGVLAGRAAAGGIGRSHSKPGDRTPGRRAAPEPPAGARRADDAHARGG